MRALVADHGRFVTRTLRKAGVPRAELDDQVQRTFIVVAARLDDIRLGSERSFLFQVAHNTASHARRSWGRRRETPSDRLTDAIEANATPEDFMRRKQTGQVLDAILDGIDESFRSVFVLYELEGMSLLDISKRLRIPRGTAASRLRRARARLRVHETAIELARDLGIKAAPPIDDPTLLRRETRSALERALLDAGTCTGASVSARARTLGGLALR